MLLHQVLVVTFVALLSSSNATETGIPKVSDKLAAPESSLLSYSNIEVQGRSLRTGGNNEAKDEDSAERGLWNNILVRWWLETGETDHAVVKKALNLYGRSGEDLTSHKNYMYYARFVRKSNEYKRIEWLKDGFTTFDVWKSLKLDTKATTGDDMLKIT